MLATLSKYGILMLEVKVRQFDRMQANSPNRLAVSLSIHCHCHCLKGKLFPY